MVIESKKLSFLLAINSEYVAPAHDNHITKQTIKEMYMTEGRLLITIHHISKLSRYTLCMIIFLSISLSLNLSYYA